MKIKRRLTGEVLLDIDNANLRGADLSGADLRRAYLRGADLSDANLRRANLSGADLSDANLRDANLNGANLRYANLRGADLHGADLRYIVGNSKEIKTIQTDKYHIVLTKDMIFISCKAYTIDEWLSFDDDMIRLMDVGALNWWRVWKPMLVTMTGSKL